MYVTIGTRKKRDGQLVGWSYQTKTLTPFHANLRRDHRGAQTWKDPESVITEFVPGMNLGTMPIVCGGERIA